MTISHNPEQIAPRAEKLLEVLDMAAEAYGEMPSRDAAEAVASRRITDLSLDMLAGAVLAVDLLITPYAVFVGEGLSQGKDPDLLLIKGLEMMGAAIRPICRLYLERLRQFTPEQVSA